MKFTTYTTLCALLAGAVTAQDFSGSGQIQVINSSDFRTATPDQTVGCLDEAGRIAESNCATFTRLDTYPSTLSSGAGNCSFTDNTQPANTDNAYGAHSYAWHCRPEFTAAISDSFYTIQGLNYTFLCHGDTNCYYDIKNLPAQEESEPVWGYIWGAHQISLPAGHTQVMFYWNKTAA